VFKLKALSGVIAAVNYMHSTGVIHADLKTQNVLLANEMLHYSSPLTLWMGDFGLAQTTHTVTTSRGSVISPSDGGSHGGTLGFVAPETIANNQISESSDIFSLAVTMWSALSCEEPFRGVSDPRTYLYQVSDENIRPDLNKLPKDVPKGIINLIRKSWDTNPENRPSIEELLNKWEYEVATAVSKTTTASSEELPNGDGFALNLSAELGALDDKMGETHTFRERFVRHIATISMYGTLFVCEFPLI
jgi:serine/threonine protein kinase